MEFITEHLEDGVWTVTLPQDIDHHVAKRLRMVIDERLLRLRPQRLILDLTQTQFMDSSGLGLLLGRARTCQELNVQYEIVNPNPSTQKLLSMAGVERMIAIVRL